MTTLLYLGMTWDYGVRAQGESYEHWNFHRSLQTFCERVGWRLIHYDFMDRGLQLGREAMTEELLATCRAERPDVVFAVLFNPKHDPHWEVFPEISRLGATTVHWFCDDHWRFENYSAFVAPYFDYVCTTARSAVPKYRERGLGHKVIKTQWACNHDLYRPLGLPRDLPVSFVGLNHGNRAQIMQQLAAKGLDVHVFGRDWPDRPRVSFQEMIEVFSRSRVNLNLSNSSTLIGNQIKGRNFEVPGCGSFMLTGQSENLDEYYERGTEIVLFDAEDEIPELASYYLAHEAERERIARAGYERTLREHTWHHRFTEIFRRVGVGSFGPQPPLPARPSTPRPQRLSIILPVPADAAFPPRALERLEQPASCDWEIVLVATQERLEQAAQLAPGHCRLVIASAEGEGAAWAAGMEAAQGEWLLPLDWNRALPNEWLSRAMALLPTLDRPACLLGSDDAFVDWFEQQRQPANLAERLAHAPSLPSGVLFAKETWQTLGDPASDWPQALATWNLVLSAAWEGLDVRVLRAGDHEPAGDEDFVLSAVRTCWPELSRARRLLVDHQAIGEQGERQTMVIAASPPRRHAGLSHLWRGLARSHAGWTDGARDDFQRALHLSRGPDWQPAWRLACLQDEAGSSSADDGALALQRTPLRLAFALSESLPQLERATAYFFEVAQSLASQGHHVVLVTPERLEQEGPCPVGVLPLIYRAAPRFPGQFHELDACMAVGAPDVLSRLPLSSTVCRGLLLPDLSMRHAGSLEDIDLLGHRPMGAPPQVEALSPAARFAFPAGRAAEGLTLINRRTDELAIWPTSAHRHLATYLGALVSEQRAEIATRWLGEDPVANGQILARAKLMILMEPADLTGLQAAHEYGCIPLVVTSSALPAGADVDALAECRPDPVALALAVLNLLADPGRLQALQDAGTAQHLRHATGLLIAQVALGHARRSTGRKPG